MYEHSHFGDRSDNIMIKLTLAMIRNIATLATILCLLIPTSAFNKASNVDEFLEANQRPRMRFGYVLQGALKNNVDNDKIGVPYVTQPFEPNTNPEELHALRNYISLLDKSFETRIPKTGNIKVKKYDPDEFNDVPCTCEQEDRDIKLLGEDYFPHALETRICDARLCPSPYGCEERLHNVTVLKRKRYTEEPSQEVLPGDLESRWIALKEPVVVGCMCVKEY